MGGGEGQASGAARFIRTVRGAWDAFGPEEGG